MHDGATATIRQWIRWIDVSATGWQLRASPLSIAEIFSKQVTDTARAWIFTSATLAIGGDFSLYQRELGLGDAATGYWESPFDYANQAMLYLPRDLPQPNSFEHTDAVVAAALPVLRASRGRAFLLFTTLRALARARETLLAEIERGTLDFPLLAQGEGSRTELLTRFRRLGNAILLGSQSFWEGVDVQGEALSLVVIDKLPFAPPDDPLFAARLEHIAREGGNPFMDYQLPQAAINLKQGAGRLIRVGDRSRRADDLRPAAGRQTLRPAYLAGATADASHARTRRRRRILWRRTAGRCEGLTRALMSGRVPVAAVRRFPATSEPCRARAVARPRRAARTSTTAWSLPVRRNALFGKVLREHAPRVIAQLRHAELVVALHHQDQRLFVGGRLRIVGDRRRGTIHRGDIRAAIVVVASDVHLVHAQRVGEIAHAVDGIGRVPAVRKAS